MPSAEFEHTIRASERPQTNALDRAATGISQPLCQCNEYPRIGMSLQYLVFIFVQVFGFSTSS